MRETMMKRLLLGINMKLINISALTACCLLISGCGNPGGISDEEYEKYRQLAAPKILYSCAKLNTKLSENFEKCLENPSASYCTQDLVETKVDVGYQAGVGSSVTYNSLLRDVQASCIGEFKRLKILASDK